LEFSKDYNFYQGKLKMLKFIALNAIGTAYLLGGAVFLQLVLAQPVDNIGGYVLVFMGCIFVLFGLAMSAISCLSDN
jgi:hypothetical protein